MTVLEVAMGSQRGVQGFVHATHRKHAKPGSAIAYASIPFRNERGREPKTRRLFESMV
jgi:hypothetical protein